MKDVMTGMIPFASLRSRFNAKAQGRERRERTEIAVYAGVEYNLRGELLGVKRRTVCPQSGDVSTHEFRQKTPQDAKIFIYIIAHTLEQEVATTLDTYTRYEYARIIGARALQISLGAPALITPDTGEPIDIAIRELEADLIPITVKRPATD